LLYIFFERNKYIFPIFSLKRIEMKEKKLEQKMFTCSPPISLEVGGGRSILVETTSASVNSTLSTGAGEY
jgi:hypothetical protein